MARDGEVKQRQHCCHHGDKICHPKSGFVTTKLHGTSTCRCNNNANQSINHPPNQSINQSLTLPLTINNIKNKKQITIIIMCTFAIGGSEFVFSIVTLGNTFSVESIQLELVPGQITKRNLTVTQNQAFEAFFISQQAMPVSHLDKDNVAS